MFRSVALIAALLGSTACSDFPRDPNATLKRVQREGFYRVGVVDPGNGPGPGREAAQLLRGISAETRASPNVIGGETEVLLTELEEGKLDLVIGRFEKKSPWGRRVTLGPTLRSERHGKAELLLVPAMRNGENAWIALIERKVRDVSPSAQ